MSTLPSIIAKFAESRQAKIALAGLILLQVMASIIWQSGDPNFLKVAGINIGDGPSYINFPWSSIQEILGGHRNFGYPLFLKIVHGIFGTHEAVPVIQLSIYFLSIIVLFLTFFHFLPKYIYTAAVFCSFLIWHKPLFFYFNYILTEAPGAAFLNFSVALSVWAVCRKRWYCFLVLGVAVFFLFQVRTALAFACFLFPVWMAFLEWAEKRGMRSVWGTFGKATLVTVLPLLAFAFLRLIVVGHLGITSLNGILLSGHASFLYQEGDEKLLSGEAKKLGEMIIQRRQNLEPPCNQFFESIESADYSALLHKRCYGPYVMSNWVAAIELIDKDKPFADDRNREPWKHMPTLSGFFNRYSVPHDNLLKQYSIPILRAHLEGYLKWVLEGGTLTILIFAAAYSKTLFWILAGSILFGFFIGRYGFSSKLEGAVFFVLVGFSFFVLSTGPVLLLNTVFVRFLELHSLYLFPAIALLVLCFFALIGERWAPAKK